MRVFPYITVGLILQEIWDIYNKKLPEDRMWKMNKHGVKTKRLPVTRPTFYRKEAKLNFPGRPENISGEEKKKTWRKYSREEANLIIELLEKDDKYFGAETVIA